jgi:hypothetical protein
MVESPWMMAAVDMGDCFLGTVNPTTLAASGTMQILLSIPVGVAAHVKDMMCNLNQAYSVAISYLSGAWAKTGQQPVLNLNLANYGALKSPKCSLWSGYTGSPTLNPIFTANLPATVGHENLLSGENEKIIKGGGAGAPGTFMDYLIVITNTSASSMTNPFFKLRWVEDVDTTNTAGP